MHQERLKKEDSKNVISFVKYQVHHLHTMDIVMSSIFSMNLNLRVLLATIFASSQMFSVTASQVYRKKCLTLDSLSNSFYVL